MPRFPPRNCRRKLDSVEEQDLEDGCYRRCLTWDLMMEGDIVASRPTLMSPSGSYIETPDNSPLLSPASTPYPITEEATGEKQELLEGNEEPYDTQRSPRAEESASRKQELLEDIEEQNVAQSTPVLKAGEAANETEWPLQFPENPCVPQLSYAYESEIPPEEFCSEQYHLASYEHQGYINQQFQAQETYVVGELYGFPVQFPTRMAYGQQEVYAVVDPYTQVMYAVPYTYAAPTEYNDGNYESLSSEDQNTGDDAYHQAESYANKDQDAEDDAEACDVQESNEEMKLRDTVESQVYEGPPFTHDCCFEQPSYHLYPNYMWPYLQGMQTYVDEVQHLDQYNYVTQESDSKPEAPLSDNIPQQSQMPVYQYYTQPYPQSEYVYQVGSRNGMETQYPVDHQFNPQYCWRMAPPLPRMRQPTCYQSNQHFGELVNETLAGTQYPCPQQYPSYFSHAPSEQYTPHYYRTLRVDNRSEDSDEDCEMLRQKYSEYRMPNYNNSKQQEGVHRFYELPLHRNPTEQYSDQASSEAFDTTDSLSCDSHVDDVENMGSRIFDKPHAIVKSVNTYEDQVGLELDLSDVGGLEVESDTGNQRELRPLLGRHQPEPCQRKSKFDSPGREFNTNIIPGKCDTLSRRLRRGQMREVAPRTQDQIDFLTDYSCQTAKSDCQFSSMKKQGEQSCEATYLKDCTQSISEKHDLSEDNKPEINEDSIQNIDGPLNQNQIELQASKGAIKKKPLEKSVPLEAEREPRESQKLHSWSYDSTQSTEAQQNPTGFQYPLSEAHMYGAFGCELYWPNDPYELCPPVYEPFHTVPSLYAGSPMYPSVYYPVREEQPTDMPEEGITFSNPDCQPINATETICLETDNANPQRVSAKADTWGHKSVPHRFGQLPQPVEVRPYVPNECFARYQDSVEEYHDYIVGLKRNAVDMRSYPAQESGESEDNGQQEHPNESGRSFVAARLPPAMRTNSVANRTTLNLNGEESTNQSVTTGTNPSTENNFRDIQCGSGDASSSSPLSPHSPPSLNSARGLYESSPSSGHYQSSPSLESSPHIVPSLQVEFVLSDELFRDTGDTETCMGFGAEHPPPCDEILSLIHNLGLARGQRRRRRDSEQTSRPILGSGCRQYQQQPPRMREYRNYPFAQVVPLPWYNYHLFGPPQDLTYESPRFPYSDYEWDLMRAHGSGPRFCHTRSRNSTLYKHPSDM